MMLITSTWFFKKNESNSLNRDKLVDTVFPYLDESQVYLMSGSGEYRTEIGAESTAS